MRPGTGWSGLENLRERSEHQPQRRAVNTGSRPTVLRRSEQTCFSSASDDEVGGPQGAIRARDVRAADLQEEPTKRLENRELTLRHNRFVGSDEDGGSPANIAASGASLQTQRALASGTIK
jgi:hypothetical protein